MAEVEPRPYLRGKPDVPARQIKLRTLVRFLFDRFPEIWGVRVDFSFDQIALMWRGMGTLMHSVKLREYARLDFDMLHQRPRISSL